MNKEIKSLENEEIEVGIENTNNTPIIYFEPIELDKDYLKKLKFGKDEFSKGLKEGSYTAGFFTGLMNSGMSIDDAINIILTAKNVDMNIKIADINAKATVESSKYQKLEMEKNSL